MELAFGREVEVGLFVGEKLGVSIVPPFAAIGILRAGKMIGGAVFNGWTGADISLTMAGPGMLSRGVMRALAHYAFIQTGCRRVSMTVRASNDLVHRLAPRCGFKIEGLKRRAYPDDDGVIYGLLPEDFPWLNLR